MMRTNIVIDDKLMNEAIKICGYKTKKETVEEALKLLIALGIQNKIRRYRGKIIWQNNGRMGDES